MPAVTVLVIHDLRILNTLGVHGQRQLEVFRSVNRTVHKRKILMNRLYAACDRIIVPDFHGLLFYRHIFCTGKRVQKARIKFNPCL